MNGKDCEVSTELKSLPSLRLAVGLMQTMFSDWIKYDL
jgi:hypothetical protein